MANCITSATPTSAQLMGAVLTEAIERIGFLNAVTPDATSQRDQLANLIGAEITKTMAQQKELEAQYQELIFERSQLPINTDKRILDQKEESIKEVAQSLRDVAALLNQALKENPHIADHLLAIHQERSFLINLLNRTLDDLREYSFSVLYTHVLDEKTRNDRFIEAQASYEETLEQKKKLEDDVERLKAQQDAAINELDVEISELKEKLQDLNKNSAHEVALTRLREEAETNTLSILFKKEEYKVLEEVEIYREKIQFEDRVNSKSVELLRNQAEKLAREGSNWNSKYEHDTNYLSSELESLQALHDEELRLLTGLREREAQEAAEIQLKLKQEEDQRQWLALQETLMEFRMRWAVVKISKAWLRYKAEGGKKKKKGKKGKKGAKKGKKGGKKGKK
ncbi:hypothetical protein RCL1_004756 [Eukaryota sp. TZLM3-RCL]